MPTQLTASRKDLQARARALAEEVIAPNAAEVDRSEAYPWDNVRALKDAGFFGMTIPAAYGARRPHDVRKSNPGKSSQRRQLAVYPTRSIPVGDATFISLSSKKIEGRIRSRTDSQWGRSTSARPISRTARTVTSSSKVRR